MQIENLSLESIKNKMIDKVIQLSEETKEMTQLEKDSYIESLRSLLNEKRLVTQVRNQGGRTDANDYNKTAYELYLDINTVFTYLDSISSMVSRHVLLNQSIVNSLHSAIDEMNDRLDEILSVIGTPGNPFCYYESFRTENNKEIDLSIYTERYGERVPEACISNLVPNHTGISLQYARKQNVMTYKNGIQLGNISITKQYGSGFIKARNPENKIDNAIDTSLSSYWSETILSDEEIKVKGLGFDSPDGKKYNRSFYDLPRGAMCEICLTFESMTKVNELDLSPFGNFPIDIVAIRYSLTDDEDGTIYDILSPNNQINPWLKTLTIKDPAIIHFPEVSCKKLYVLINQLHCIKNTYLISSNQMFKNQLWFNATNNQETSLRTEGTTVFKPVYLDKSEEDPIWKYVNNKMVSNKNIDINQLILQSSEKMIPVTKYQYSYGFYNVAPNFVDFQRATVYVSKVIDVQTPINTVKLYSEEEHYESSEGLIVTDIEFYVTSKKNPTYKDWKPICPYNKHYVYKELLQMDYDYCYLRHKAVCENRVVLDSTGVQTIEYIRPIVYMNDIVLIEDTDYILRFDEMMNAIAIEISNIDHFALYTVSYKPVDTEKEIPFIMGDGTVTNNSLDEIIGNGSSCFKLSEFPYYENEGSSSYLKIINIKTGKIMSQEDNENSLIQCVTNKENQRESYKNFTNTNKIQYYTSNGYLYFNRSITKDEKIEINYPSFGSSIRLKAILRRNTKKDSWITPVLKSYRLEVVSL